MLVSELIPYLTQPHQGSESLKQGLVSKLIWCTTQPRQWADSLKHRLVKDLIRWITDSSANLNVEALIHRRTNSLDHRISSADWSAKHRLLSRMLQGCTTRQRTDSGMHNLVKKLIHWSTHSSTNWFPRPHYLVKELIRRSRDSSVDWFDAPHNLVTELIRWSKESSLNYCAEADTSQGTDRRSSDSSANWVCDAHARQRTDSVNPRK
jgi:hypothetical protein